MAITSERGFFKSLFSFNTTTVPQRMGSTWFYPIGSDGNVFGGSDYMKDFMEIPELNAILNIRARAMSSGTVKIVSKTTGEETKSNETLQNILRNPNWFQSQEEFWRQSSLFRDIFGNEYIYFLSPVGLKSYKGMFTLPPNMMKVKYSKDQPFFNYVGGDHVEYYYKFNQREYPLEKENIAHLNDNRVDTENLLLGVSKLKALQPNLKNIRAAYKKRNIVLNMPIGIISNGNSGDATGQAVPLTKEEKDGFQNDLRNHGALPIATSLALNYSDMSINANNMGLFDECIEDTGRICDAFGVPYKVLSSAKAGTLNTGGGELKESKKQMYEEAIIPDMNERIAAINNTIGADKRSWELRVDFSHLPVFSENFKERSQTINTTVNGLSRALADGAITLEQYKAELAKFGI